MNLQECYHAFGGDYEGTMARLRSERIVAKFVRKFPQDGTYATLKTSLEEENLEEAFRAAHTMKGICKNLGLEQLYGSVEEITEVLRTKDRMPSAELFDHVTRDYELTLRAIGELEG